METRASQTVSLRRFTRYKENLLWSWVPGLAQATSDNTVSRYLDGFFHMWNTQYPIPRRTTMRDSTYFKKVEEREQILTLELMRRLSVWRHQQAQYGNSLTYPHSTATPGTTTPLDTPPPAPFDAPSPVPFAFDAIGGYPRDTGTSPQPGTLSDREVDFPEPDVVQHSGTSSLFSDDTFSQHSGTPDTFPNNFFKFSVDPYDVVTADKPTIDPSIIFGNIPDQGALYERSGPSSHTASLIRTDERCSSPRVCETVSANADTIKVLLQWIEELKRRLAEQHKEAGCEVCYGNEH